MFQKKVIGWVSLVLFVFAAAIIAILVLLITIPPLAAIVSLDPQVMIGVSGILALMAAIFGFYAFQTFPGRFSAVGGLVLFIAIAILLSYTAITVRIEGHSAQPTLLVENGATVAKLLRHTGFPEVSPK